MPEHETSKLAPAKATDGTGAAISNVSIPLTELGTSDPLDLCKGLAIFPKLGTIRAGVSSSSTAHTILSKSLTILLLRGSASVGYDLFFGICGPSFAAKYRLEGSGSGKELQMTVSGDSMEAGLFVGANLSLPIHADLQAWWPNHWYTPWWGAWHTTASFGINPRIDLLGLILFIILKALDDESAFKKVNDFVPGLIGSWGMIGSAGGGFSGDRGTMRADPVFNVPVNILPMIPGIGEIDEGLSKIGLTVATGPQIGIGTPVTLKLESVKLDDSTYNISGWTANDAFTATGPEEVPSSPRNLTSGFSHEPGLTFTVGWFGSLSLWKLFRISGSVSIDILGMLGLHIDLGTYQNNLSNTIGSTSISDCGTCGADAQSAELKIIFEDPA